MRLSQTFERVLKNIPETDNVQPRLSRCDHRLPVWHVNTACAELLSYDRGAMFGDIGWPRKPPGPVTRMQRMRTHIHMDPTKGIQTGEGHGKL